MRRHVGASAMAAAGNRSLACGPDHGGKEGRCMEDEDQRPVVTLELRGRDLAVVPPNEWWQLADDALSAALFGAREAEGAAHLLTRDPRGCCLRARPMHFERLRDALLAQGACAVRVAFEQHPLLPAPLEPRVTARP